MAQIVWPFDTSYVSEWCGGFSDVRSGIHMGTDFAVPQGTELRATTDGTVRIWSTDAGGNGIDITNSDGIVVRNWHLSQFNVTNGEYVTIGQVIGLTGGGRGTWGAGNSTGPHLHWELRDNSRFNDVGWIDPRDLSIGSLDGTTPAPAPVSTVGSQGEGIRGQGSDWTYWVPGTNDQMTVQSRLAERGLYSGPIDGDLASDASVRAIKLACGNLGYFDLTYWDGEINKNLCYGILLLAQNHGGYSGFNNLFTDGYVWAAFDGGVASAIAIPAPPTPAPVVEEPKPAPKPEAAEHKPQPEGETVEITKEPTEAELAHQTAVFSAVKSYDIGSIITDPLTRKIVWAVWTVIGLAIVGIGGGFMATQQVAPEWLIFAGGVNIALQPAFGSLAIANITTKKKSK